MISSQSNSVNSYQMFNTRKVNSLNRQPLSTIITKHKKMLSLKSDIPHYKKKLSNLRSNLHQFRLSKIFKAKISPSIGNFIMAWSLRASSGQILMALKCKRGRYNSLRLMHLYRAINLGTIQIIRHSRTTFIRSTRQS